MLDVRPLDTSPAGIEKTCALLNVVFPNASHITPAYLDRLYNENPLGPTFGFSAFEEGELVGHYLMIPLVTVIHGIEEPGIWPFQLATHPGFRGKGLFSALVERSFDAARERGFGHFVGVGNALSTPIFVRKWGFENICPLDVKIGAGPIPPRQAGAADLQLYRVWSPEGVAWRLRHPARPYHVKYRGDCGHLHARTGRLGIWVEIGAFPREMLPQDLSEYRAANPLKLWIGKDPSREWSRSLYCDVPMRFRPSPLHLLFHDLADQKRKFDPGRVRYDVFDFDAY
jgi:predicted N-acetyltransferase YhbS